MLRGTWEPFAVDEKGRRRTSIRAELTNTNTVIKKNIEPKLDGEGIAFFLRPREKTNFGFKKSPKCAKYKTELEPHEVSFSVERHYRMTWNPPSPCEWAKPLPKHMHTRNTFYFFFLDLASRRPLPLFILSMSTPPPPLFFLTSPVKDSCAH